MVFKPSEAEKVSKMTDFFLKAVVGLFGLVVSFVDRASGLLDDFVQLPVDLLERFQRRITNV